MLADILFIVWCAITGYVVWHFFEGVISEVFFF